MYLAVRDSIKLLHNLLGEDDVIFLGGQRVRRRQGIDCKRSVDIFQNDQVFLSETGNTVSTNLFSLCAGFSAASDSHHVPRWLSVVCSQVRHVGGETLVQPNLVPPAQSHQVTKPLGKT